MSHIKSKGKILAALSVAVLTANVAFGGELKTIRYSKTEIEKLSKDDFTHASDLSDVLASKLKLIIITVTQRQSGSNVATRDVVASGLQPSKTTYWKRMATLSTEPESITARGNDVKLRTTLSMQTRKAAEVQIKGAFPIFEKIRNGLNFNMDILNPGQSIQNKNHVPTIRYGLVEAEIIPSEKAIPIATLGSISDVSPEYSSRAKVIYTIDQITSNPNAPVFNDTQPTPADHSELQSTSVWRKAPSTQVKLKVDAADQDAAVSDQIGSGSIPGARFTFTQADSFITTKFVAGGKSDARKSMTTELKAPLYGEMSLARIYDYKMQATHTSALNIFGDSSLPRVNLSYAHKDKKAKGEWIVKKGNFEYSVIAEPRQGWFPDTDQKLGRVGDKVSLNLNKTF